MSCWKTMGGGTVQSDSASARKLIPIATFTVVLTPESKAGGYSVSVPALPGCFSQGDTLEGALENIREAIGLHMWGMQQDGDAIPPDVTPTVTTVNAELIEGQPVDEKELAAINDAPPSDGRHW